MFGNKITKTIFIEGMHCEHCSKRVTEALKSVKGVKSVFISLEEKKAEITVKTDMKDESLRQVIEDIGFEVTEIKT